MSEAVAIRPLLTVEDSVINLVLDVFHKPAVNRILMASGLYQWRWLFNLFRELL
jgi:hypothetical protein